jgi:hypothetical protein
MDMPMKNSSIVLLYRNLQNLDGHLDVESKKTVPYKFAGNTAYAIAKNMKRAKAAVELIDEVRVKLLRDLLKEGETEIKQGDPRFEEFQKEYVSILNSEGDFVPHKFKVSDLNLNQNPIQPSVILALDDILIDDNAPDNFTTPTVPPTSV